MNKKLPALFFILPTLAFSAVNAENGVSGSPQTIRIMSFNIQTLGVSKMSRPEVVDLFKQEPCK